MKLRDMVKTVAPAIATALGGPLAGTAVRVLSEKFLGKADGKPEEIEALLSSATPEQIIELKKIDNEFKEKLLGAGIKLEEIEVADRSSARSMFMTSRDSTPAWLTYSVIAVWAIVQYMLFTQLVPAESRDLIARMLGTLDAALLAVMNFWFGSSRSSREKNETIANLAK